jgi:hypothetical protein
MNLLSQYMQLELNPPGIIDDYLRCLNVCFSHWGDAPMAQWALQRALPPDPPPDLMVFRQDGELLAGSAVSYRSVALPNGKLIRTGIMTGSWTLPAARGRGCFSSIIDESATITRTRGGSLLLAFVTEENPSCRQLLKAGATPFPTAYLFADPENPGNKEVSVIEEFSIADERTLRDMFSHWDEVHKRKCRFEYSTFENWKSQVMDRPGDITAIRHLSGSFAIVEKIATTNRIHAWWGPSKTSVTALLRALCADAQQNGRKLFSFSTDPEFVALCTSLSFTKKVGYLTAIVTDWRSLGQALQTTEPATSTNHVLLDPSSPWFMGDWALQAGDRM